MINSISLLTGQRFPNVFVDLPDLFHFDGAGSFCIECSKKYFDAIIDVFAERCHNEFFEPESAGFAVAIDVNRIKIKPREIRVVVA